MFLLLALMLPLNMASASGTPCGPVEVCAQYAYENEEMAVCSSRDSAQIWNTTSGECQVHIDADLRTVSYMSQIFTFGVTPAVRYRIGEDCWNFVPENVAIAIIQNEIQFDPESVCASHPYNEIRSGK